MRGVGKFCSPKLIEAHIYQVPPLLHIMCKECGEMVLFPKKSIEAHIYQVHYNIRYFKCEEFGALLTRGMFSFRKKPNARLCT